MASEKYLYIIPGKSDKGCMIPSAVEIASPNLYLSKTRGFLIIKEEGGDLQRLPLDDIGVLLLTSPRATLSTSLMNALAERGIITMLCDVKQRPASYLCPYQPHGEMAARLREQIKASLPLKKRLWQSVVKAKISHQASILEILGRAHVNRLKKLSREVTSGDKENREAQAARVYWTSLMGKEFRRQSRSGGCNTILDFGYGILRAATLRAIAGSGLNPSLGVSHSSGRNPYCLADDLLEPFRPLVDYAAYRLNKVNEVELGAATKKLLGSLMTVKLATAAGASPTARSMSILCQSLVRSYETGRNELAIPLFPAGIAEHLEALWAEADFS